MPGLRELRCLLGCVGLVDEPQFVDAFEFPRRDLPEIDAGAGAMLDEPLSLELQKRVADGATADAEIAGENAVRQPLPGQHRPLHDHAADLAVGPRGQVFLFSDACGHGRDPWAVRDANRLKNGFRAVHHTQRSREIGRP